jgi:hypothetical protein
MSGAGCLRKGGCVWYRQGANGNGVNLHSDLHDRNNDLHGHEASIPPWQRGCEEPLRLADSLTGLT